jgi:hydroxymethylglutaryl-CoA reductase|tara:strand:- start:81 stop:1382 length:1302 start_codon:yes stop_codon:yes gene_type:complete
MPVPVDNSRLKGFFRLSAEERLQLIADIAGLSEQDIAALSPSGGLKLGDANNMVENVIGTMSMPIGIATNFIIDGKHHLIPYCIEESSVIAAASNMAKRCHISGGFQTNNDDSLMIGQIQLLEIPHFETAKKAILEAKQSLIDDCNSRQSTIIRLGGGCKDIEVRQTGIEGMMIIHIIVDCLEAMGANTVNTMTERIAPRIEALSGGRAHLKILSNLAIHRLARASATFTPEEISRDGSREDGLVVISGILEAYQFADIDPFRATTHNKGTMNGISAVAMACGQDWRAIEAACHSYVVWDQGRYGSLTEWEQDENGSLVGRIEVPLAVGTVGGAVKVHPTAGTNMKILGVDSAKALAGVMACAGLAQNLGALRALSTSGIQSGHMRLHLRNMATTSGAKGDEIDAVSQMVEESGEPITQSLMDAMLDKHRISD